MLAEANMPSAHMIFTIFAWMLPASIVAPALSEDLGPYNKGCYENYGSYETIQACSAVIAGGFVTKEDLATAFRNRANAYDDLGLFNRAIDDYDHAIAINPSDADSYNDRDTLASRGFTYLKLERYEAAIADYDAELRINPENPYTLFGRGIAKRMKGSSSGGDADIAAATAITSDIADEMAKLGVQHEPGAGVDTQTAGGRRDR
jgi:tetratricopeptide (TPR) repeat protein